MCIEKIFLDQGTVHFLRGRGGWWDLGGGSPKKKNALKGGPSKKNKGKRGGHVKYFSNALRWNMFYYS